MTERGGVTLHYRAVGAERVQQQDRKVKKGLQDTQKTAKKGAPIVENWMKIHRTALLAIGGAAFGLMAGVLASSSIAEASLTSLRMTFGILADSIFIQLEPAFLALEESILGLDAAFNNLPEWGQQSISFGLAIAAMGALGFFGFMAIAAAAGAAGMAIAPFLVAALTFGFVVGIVAAALAGLIVIWTSSLSIWEKLALTFATIGLAGAAVAFVIGALSLPVLLVVGLIAGLIFAGVLLYRNWEKVKEVGRIVWTAMAAGAALAIEKIRGFFQGIADFAGLVWTAMMAVGATLASAVGGFISDAVGWGADLLLNFAKGITGAIGVVGDAAAGAWNAVADWLSFDIAVNDRMVEKFGFHAGTLWATGLAAAMPTIDGTAQLAQDVAFQSLAATPREFPTIPTRGESGGRGDTIIQVTIEAGAIQMGEGESRHVDEDRLAERIGRQFGEQVRWR